MGNTSIQSKGSAKRISGIVLVGVLLILLLATIYDLMMNRVIDFPCEAGLGPRPEILSGTRIAYCISFWPRQPSSGGDVYAVGGTDHDEVTVNGQIDTALGALTLARQEQALVVNAQALQPKESYNGFGWRFTSNPWLLLTARVTLTNEGIAPTRNEISSNAILVSGGVYEGWLPGPIGIITLIFGIWLIRRGNQERKHAQRSER